MRAATRLRLPLAIAAGLFAFSCLLTSAAADSGQAADNGYAQLVLAVPRSPSGFSTRLRDFGS